jgi:hypothetical protein
VPQVRIEPLRDIPSGTSSMRVDMNAQVYRNGGPAIRISTDDVNFPTKIQQWISGSTLVNLPTIPVDCYWRISLRSRTDYIRRTVVFPGNVGPYDFDDLVDIDPLTVLPDAGTGLSEALVDQLTAIQVDVNATADSIFNADFMEWRGAWSSLVTYNTNDVIQFTDTFTYVCVVDGTTGSPSAAPASWVLIGGGGASTPPEPYEHIQSSPNTTWTITHNLGYKPASISLINSANTVFLAQIEYVDNNTLRVHMVGAQSGTAYVK